MLGDVEQICDRVGILAKGRLTVQGRIDQLLSAQVTRVEVIVHGLNAESVRDLASRSQLTRRSEAGDHFYVSDLDAANALVRAAHANGF